MSRLIVMPALARKRQRYARFPFGLIRVVVTVAGRVVLRRSASDLLAAGA